MVWTGSGSAGIQWASYTWRRGTVPIWWGVEIKSGGVGEATIVVNPEKPYKGTKRSLLSLPGPTLCQLAIFQLAYLGV